MSNIDIDLARRILSIVDQGLVVGVGTPEPGKLCVEAAVCLALGLPHGDSPPYVAEPDRRFKTRLNDASWSSPAARASGLRRLAVMQLGTAGTDRSEWGRILAELTIRRVVPELLEAAARVAPDHAVALRAAAERCRTEGTREAALNAKQVATSAYAATTSAATSAYAATAYAAATSAYATSAYAATTSAATSAYAATTSAAAALNAIAATSYATYAAIAAAYAATATHYADGRDRILTISARCAEEAYERTGSPGMEFLRQLEAK